MPVLRQFAQRAVEITISDGSLPTGTPLFLEEIAVLLMSDEQMTKLHEQFLHQTGTTDVITFQHGEIFISVATANRQARDFGTSLMREIQLYIVHGLLHLCGYDDHSSSDRKKMRAAEARILRRASV
jgi:probable rRNA maturation factor